MLYPYLSTAGGLAQWFADDVVVTQNKQLDFFWDKEKYRAHIVSQKQNKLIKFEFRGDDNSNGHTDHPFIEIDLDSNDLTGTVFMKITDTMTSSEDLEELREIWQYLTDNLKEIVGG